MSELKQKQLVSHRNQSTDLQSKSVIQDTVCSLIVLNKCSYTSTHPYNTFHIVYRKVFPIRHATYYSWIHFTLSITYLYYLHHLCMFYMIVSILQISLSNIFGNCHQVPYSTMKWSTTIQAQWKWRRGGY